MKDLEITLPQFYREIQIESDLIGFSMPSDLQTGSLLRTLISSKPNSKFLEIGTGTGLSLAWIVEGMDAGSTVISIDNSEPFSAIARKFFDADKRVSILCEDGGKWIKENQETKFDLIFADAWPGKYDTFDEGLSLLKKGGFYILDDMLPQPNWPTGHEDNVNRLINDLETRKNIKLTKMNWSTGIIIITKIDI